MQADTGHAQAALAARAAPQSEFEVFNANFDKQIQIQQVKYSDMTTKMSGEVPLIITNAEALQMLVVDFAG